MDPEQQIGTQLGENGVNNVVTNVEQFCAHAVQCITLENRAPIAMLSAEYGMLAKQAEEIEAQLESAPRPSDVRYFRRKKVFAWVVTAFLTLAALFLAVLTFAPFRLGWQSYVFSIGMVVVCPFLMEELFEGGKLDVWMKPLAVIAIVAGISSLMLMAHVRGNLLKQEVETPRAVVFDDAQPEQAAQQNDFYAKSTDLLSLATVLLSLAMELGAGLAMRRAWAKLPHNAEDYQRLQRELVAIRGRMIMVGGKATQLEAEPGIFEAKLWRDFYKSMLTQTVRSAARKLLIVFVVLAIVPLAHAATEQPLNLIIALDLTKSTDVKGPDGKTEFQKNVDGVTGILAQMPAGSHITVIGITGNSFAQPYILLSATVPSDPGYFGERLKAARQQIVAAWKLRSGKLTPQFIQTDILGALQLAGQLFDQRQAGPGRRILVVFSDMRNSTHNLDLETRRGLADASHRNLVSQQVQGLQGVEVDALGVEGSVEQSGDWAIIAELWRKYLNSNGAALPTYTPLRTVPAVSFK